MLNSLMVVRKSWFMERMEELQYTGFKKVVQMINEREKLIKDEVANAKHVLVKFHIDNLFHTVGIKDIY